MKRTMIAIAQDLEQLGAIDIDPCHVAELIDFRLPLGWTHVVDGLQAIAKTYGVKISSTGNDEWTVWF